MAWIARRWRTPLSDPKISLNLYRSLSSITANFSEGCFAGIPGLRQPHNWNDLARDATSKCQDLVNQVITSPPSAETVRLLDDVSDTLCKVLDAAEFCRNVHSDPQWRAAAERVCIDLGSYVHELNTHYSLYTALKAAIPSATSTPPSSFSPTAAATAAASHHNNTGSTSNNNATSINGFTEETLLVGRMLLRDFERYGVHLSGTAQDQMTRLVSTTQALGFAFTQNIIDPSRCGQLKVSTAENDAMKEAVERLPYELRRLFRPWQQQQQQQHGGSVGSIQGLVMSGTSSSLLSLTTSSDDEILRKEAYTVYCTSPKENLKILDELINARHEMAALMGFHSYAAYQLDNFSLAATPHAVETFLDELANAVKPAADREALKLAEIKRKQQRHPTGSASTFSTFSSSSSPSLLLLEPWDTSWAMNKAIRGGPSDQLSRHFDQHVTLDGCLAGLSLLLEKTLNIKIIETSMTRGGESWAPGVRKLRVVDCTTGAFLGIVYLDLYKRENKFPGAAHFTLRCGKKKRSSFKEQQQQLIDGGMYDEYQTPVVALVANFRGGSHPSTTTTTATSSSPSSPSSRLGLTHQEVETFFHEFGHALNSLLSRTEYQHLSGTRGPQDIIEIPSHVFERFSLDYETITLLVHLSQNSTNATSTKGTKGDIVVDKNVEKTAEMLSSAALASKQEFAALTLQSTLSLCAIDQVLHGKNPPVGTDAEREIAGIMQKYNSIYEHGGGREGGFGGSSGGDLGHRHQHHHRLHPHLRFNHLIGYGSNYYCYLFAQCISSSLWEGEKLTTTKAAAGARAGEGVWPDGAVLRRQLLEPGGAKPAHQYVNDLFTSSSTSNTTDTRKNKNKNDSDMLVAVQSPENGGGSTGWYPKFDSLLRHLGIYKPE